jgi:hypothetical protein
MKIIKSLVLTAVAIVTILPLTKPVLAEQTIFGGVDNELEYEIKRAGTRAKKYIFKIDGSDLPGGARAFSITYGEGGDFRGRFDLLDDGNIDLTVKVNGKKVPVYSSYWDPEALVIDIDLMEEVLAGDDVEITFNKVRRANEFGTFYFECIAMSNNDTPIPYSCGTWIVMP